MVIDWGTVGVMKAETCILLLLQFQVQNFQNHRIEQHPQSTDYFWDEYKEDLFI